jgi:flagellar protein FliL
VPAVRVRPAHGRTISRRRIVDETTTRPEKTPFFWLPCRYCLKDHDIPHGRGGPQDTSDQRGDAGMANEPAAPPKSGRKMLIVWALFALVAIGAGAALPWAFGTPIKEMFAPPKKAEATKNQHAAIPFDDVIVNLGEEKMNRYLRVKLMIAVEESDVREVTELVTKQKAFLKSWLICYLSDQSSQEVTRRAGVNRVRREICDQFNLMLYPNSEGKIVDILFDMFVVQQ